MKLRSGKQVSKQSELLECDSDKRSAKVFKIGQKRKEACEVINPVGNETIPSSSVNEDSGDFHLRQTAVPCNSTGSKISVMKHCGHISSSADALTNLPARSSSTVKKNEVLTYFHQTSSTRSSCSGRSSEESSANVCTNLSSLCSSEMSPSSSSNIGCLMQDNRPLIVDVTNIRKDKTENKKNVCSVVNSILDKECDSIGMANESDKCILKIPSIKRRRCSRSVKMLSQNVKAMTAKTPTVTVHKDKCSGQEDDACSVISLGSDDEVIILDSDPKPQLDCSSASDIVILDTLPSKKCVPTSDPVIINLCTPLSQSDVSKSPVHRVQKCMNRKDKTKQKKIKPKVHKKSAFKDYVSLLGSVPHTTGSRPQDMSLVTSCFTQQSFMPFATATSASSIFAPAINSSVRNTLNSAVVAASRTVEYNQMYVTSAHIGNFQYPNPNAARMGLQPVNNQVDLAIVPSSSVYGNNLYNPNPNPARVGLRPIVIDGSNVAMGHTNGRNFSCRGLEICIDYFLKRNHRVVAFVPQFRKSCRHSLDTHILDRLEKQGLVSFTPSRKVGDRLVIPYDDRYIVQYAAECGGVIVSTDNYRDLLRENPAWRETIETRLLMFTWVGDILMFPQDPLGRNGPDLERFLRFP
ncbi:hypothetical protein B7P43_G00760 [Cryptotermes secundus]|uniref:RNase NYN domain-containing protein n=1 Tax=Cryptotermes secundus TaxID=105785 RepID=A0A2J7QSK9_9NEOP|nr:NEDD4-binding protein 1 isoform X2 [Cryptotermes secundus]PNF31570.1 hypothetical protein B7P43_G00760 [Cryptotermes secundus]PNF31572.1 hypothetical protein B7P43_G00760 [Cryptotermes secundus]